MNHSAATNAIHAIRNRDRWPVRSVTPVLASMAAACTLRGDTDPTLLCLQRDAKSMAESCGLINVIRGDYHFPFTQETDETAFCSLAKIETHHDVEECKSLFNAFFRTHLSQDPPEMLQHLAVVVGELHNNIAFHANAPGFSCAQVLDDEHGKRIEFAIADAGTGMLANVQRRNRTLSKAFQAIQWCLEAGNSAASNSGKTWMRPGSHDNSEDRAMVATSMFRDHDHHQGNGLHQVRRLVETLDGQLWIASDNGEVHVDGGETLARESAFHWRGVAIELILPIQATQRTDPCQDQETEQTPENVEV